MQNSVASISQKLGIILNTIFANRSFSRRGELATEGIKLMAELLQTEVSLTQAERDLLAHITYNDLQRRRAIAGKAAELVDRLRQKYGR